MNMNKIFICLAVVSLLVSSCGQSVRDVISGQLADYPESRVQDIYKSFCQDNLGPEHLIPNPEAARNYLQSELKAYRSDLDSARYEIPAKRYEPVGDCGNYVRVELSVVLDSLISEDAFLDAFVRSANAGQNMTPEQWKHKWHKVAALIRKDFPNIPDCQSDLEMIDSLVAGGNLILHHSPSFSRAYNPHYRIIARSIFEEEIKPKIAL